MGEIDDKMFCNEHFIMEEFELISGFMMSLDRVEEGVDIVHDP